MTDVVKAFKEMLQESGSINQVADIRDTLDPLDESWQLAEDRLRELLKAKYPTEEIMVIMTGEMDEAIKAGYTPIENGTHVLHDLSKIAFFVPRYQAEFNPAYKQIIPYVMAIKGDRVFTMTRIQGDSRLIGNKSVGIGGHINPVDTEDATESNILLAGLSRELHEEVELGDDNYGRIVLHGYIYDPSNSIGKDHLGLAFTLELHNDSIKIRETEALSGELRPVSELGEDQSKLENWTQIVYNNILK